MNAHQALLLGLAFTDVCNAMLLTAGWAAAARRRASVATYWPLPALASTASLVQCSISSRSEALAGAEREK